MIGYKALKRIFQGRLDEARNAPNDPDAYRQARIRSLREVFDAMGLDCDDDGAPQIPTDERGFPELKEGRNKTREFSFAALGEAIFGLERFRELYHPVSGVNFSRGLRGLSEAAGSGADVGPDNFIDINTYNAAIAGLVNAEIMTRFMHPKYVGRDLVAVKQTKMNGRKLIGIVPVSPQTAASVSRGIGEQHRRVQIGGAYQTTPATQERALSIEVAKEAVYFDLTGDVLDAAGDGVGDELGRQMEVVIADCILGITSSYNRNGTAYGTYQTSSPFINDHTNPFSDETDIDDARQLFVGMTDPETGREIMIDGRTILCMPGAELKFRDQLFAPDVQIGTQLNSNFPSRWKMTKSQINAVGAGGGYTIIPLTSIWYNRAKAADGLALSASDARGLWFVGDFGDAADGDGSVWFDENWGMTTWQASADELQMKDRGLIAVYGANWRGNPYVREPRRIVRNKAA